MPESRPDLLDVVRVLPPSQAEWDRDGIDVGQISGRDAGRVRLVEDSNRRQDMGARRRTDCGGG